MAEFKNLDSDEGLASLNKCLESRSYLHKFSPSKSDNSVFEQLNIHNVNCKKFPHVARWYAHINSFPFHVRQTWGGAGSCGAAAAGTCAKGPCTKSASSKGETCTKAEKAAEKPAPAAADDDDDMMSGSNPFDDAGEDEDDERDAAIAKIAADKAAKDAAAGKKKVIAKSTLILDVKPSSSDTVMAKLEEDIRAIKMEGLTWAGSELVPVAYGIKKLRIISVIVDDLVSVDELTEKIESNEEVQSTDIYAFNKV
jgi:elongation factor 1-beta